MLTLLCVSAACAQPGYYGAFAFKLFYNNELVNLSEQAWQVVTYKQSGTMPTHSYSFPDFYQISVDGGNGKAPFFVDIIHEKDSMRIYPPTIDFRTVTFDHIDFKKGVFNIPNHLYNLQDLLKKSPDYYEYSPNIKGNWDLFAAHKEVYKCYLEQVEALDFAGTPLLAADQGQAMNWKSTSFLYKKNYIIKHHDGYDKNNHWDNKHYIYEIKNVSTATFWGGQIGGYEILSLYAKGSTLYAIVKKSYPDLKGDTFGVYKLHFVDESPITGPLATLLKKQQTTEDYHGAMKLQGYGGALRQKIEAAYNQFDKKE
ncbi:MAG: hypothetical protein CFE24_10170 [Flavobacterium sp. BFFFF2]|nr:MAG: hypothetical protein CFE24_10170 [Flavobacterium sp. BFFFF2]